MIDKDWIRLYELLSDLETTPEDFKKIEYCFSGYYLTASKYKDTENDLEHKVSIDVSDNGYNVLRIVYASRKKYVGIKELLDFIDNVCYE